MKKTLGKLGLATMVATSPANSQFSPESMYYMQLFAAKASEICMEKYISKKGCIEWLEDTGKEFGATAEYECRDVEYPEKVDCMNKALVKTIVEDGPEKLESMQGQDL